MSSTSNLASKQMDEMALSRRSVPKIRTNSQRYRPVGDAHCSAAFRSRFQSADGPERPARMALELEKNHTPLNANHI